MEAHESEDELLDQLPAHLRNKVLDHLMGEEERAVLPYNRKRLVCALIGFVLLMPWTLAWLAVLIPLSIAIPFITIPLFFGVIGVPSAACLVALTEEFARRAIERRRLTS